MAMTISLSTLPIIKQRGQFIGLRPITRLKGSRFFPFHNRNQVHIQKQRPVEFRKLVILAVTKGSNKPNTSDDNIPSWAKPDSVEPPPWAREEVKKTTSQPTFEIPFYAYLLASAITAIAAVGSIFEYVNQRPVFGIIQSDSIFYAPLLGFFAFTGIPTSVYLWFKSVQAANKEAEEQDRRDGYR